MKALVTGANGFIGSNLVLALLAGGHEARAMCLENTPLGVLEKTAAEIVYGDLRRPASLARCVEGVDVVFHLAALATDWAPAALVFEVNRGGTENLLAAAAGEGVSRFVLVSSLAVHRYRHIVDGDESLPRGPVKLPYSLSKIQAEDACRRAHERGEVACTIVRPGLFPFGPYDMTSFYHLAGALEKGLYAHVDGGRRLLCTSYVENLAAGLILAGTRPEAAGRLYVITDNEKVSWRELIEKISLALGRRPPRLSVPYPAARALATCTEKVYRTLSLKSVPPLTRYRAAVAGHDLHFVSRRAAEELGYRPKVGLDEGLRRTVKWYRSVKGA